MTKTVVDGNFKDSPYSGLYRVGVPSGVINLAPFGAAATPEIRKKVDATFAKLKSGWVPFEGPIKDQSGKEEIPAGKTPDRHTLESTDYLVQGVVGRIPGGS
jgi:basic membrane lipoprotein Med (substrate-binding protein (PBP1-ABC) superfamily)